MALSREMEFHADAVAARLVGRAPMSTSLLRLSMGEAAVNSAADYYSRHFLKRKELPANIFSDYSAALMIIARMKEMTLENNLPTLTLEDSEGIGASKLRFGEQWASHPSMTQRIANIEKSTEEVGLTVSGSAIHLVENLEQLEREMTDELYAEALKQEGTIRISTEDFENKLKSEWEEKRFPKALKEHFSYVNIMQNHEVTHEAIEKYKDLTWDDLFNAEIMRLINANSFLLGDKETLLQLSKSRRSGISHFEYDGVKYKASKAMSLASKLTDQLRKEEKTIQENEEKIFFAFLKWEREAGFPSGRLEELWSKVVEVQTELTKWGDLPANIYRALEFTLQTLEYDVITAKLRDFRKYEIKLKKAVEYLLTKKGRLPDTPDEVWKDMQEFVDNDWEYFNGRIYLEKELQKIYLIVNDFGPVFNELQLVEKRELLNYMDEIRAKLDLAPDKVLS